MTEEQFKEAVDSLRPKNVDCHTEATINHFFTQINGKGVFITQEFCISFLDFNDPQGDGFVCIERTPKKAITLFTSYLVRKNFM